MAIKNSMIKDLADELTKPKPDPIEKEEYYNPLTGKDLNSDVVIQFEKDVHPRFVHEVIRRAQSTRLRGINDTSSIYSNKMATLTTYEKNFMVAYEQAVRKGDLLKSIAEVDEYIKQLLKEQENDT